MRPTVNFNWWWLASAMLIAVSVASSVVAEETVSAEQMTDDAIRAGQARDFNAVKVLAERLSHESPVVRQSCAWALSQLGESASVVVPSLIQALGDSEVRVRWAVAAALGQIGPRASAAESRLWQTALDRSIDVRCAALAALRTVSVTKHSAALIALTECLRCPVTDVQAEAVATLSAIHARWNDDEKRAIAVELATVCASSNDEIRLAAIMLLGDLGLSSAEAISSLVEATDDIDEHIQAAAVRSVGRFADDAERRWGRLDAGERDALRRPCEVALKMLGDRGRGSDEITRITEQFERLSGGIKLASAEDLVVPRRTSISSESIGLGAANETRSETPTESQPKAKLPTSSRWRLICGILLVSVGLWGLQQKFLRPAQQHVLSANETRDAVTPTPEPTAVDAPVDDIATRRTAINSLSDNVLDAAATLNRAMRDNDSVVRWRSASAVTAVHVATVPELLAAVNSEDPEVRRLAITSLRGVGADAVPPFVKVLQDDDAQLRQAAAVTLGRIGLGAIDAVPQLTVTLADDDPRVRAAAALALATFGAHAMEAVPALRTALSDEFAAVRARAAFALGQIGPSARRAAEELIRLVSDPDVSVRSNVASALGGIGADTAVILPALRRVASDPDAGVRRCALATLALFDTGSPPTVSQPAVADAQFEVDQSVRDVQKRVDDKQSSRTVTVDVTKKTPLLDSSSIERTSSVAVPAVPRIEAAAMGLKVFAPEQLEHSAVTDEANSPPEVADFIVQLEDADADVRWKASQSLERLGASAVPEMIASLNHRNPAVRRLLIIALGRVGAEACDAIPVLLVALHDVNSDVRCAAADCLGRLGVVNYSMVQALVKSLSDPNAEVRRYAATTLGRFGQQACEATTALQIASISDSAAKVRTAAQTALKRISESLVGAA